MCSLNIFCLILQFKLHRRSASARIVKTTEQHLRALHSTVDRPETNSSPGDFRCFVEQKTLFIKWRRVLAVVPDTVCNSYGAIRIRYVSPAIAKSRFIAPGTAGFLFRPPGYTSRRHRQGRHMRRVHAPSPAPPRATARLHRRVPSRFAVATTRLPRGAAEPRCYWHHAARQDSSKETCTNPVRAARSRSQDAPEH